MRCSDSQKEIDNKKWVLTPEEVKKKDLIRFCKGVDLEGNQVAVSELMVISDILPLI